MKTLHIITGLNTGGAEMMLIKLFTQLDRDAFQPTVVVLTDRGTLGDRVEKLGIPMHTLEMRGGGGSLKALAKLRRIVRSCRPDVIQGWMYHANLAAVAAKAMAGGTTPIVWSVHNAIHDLKTDRYLPTKVIRASVPLNRLVKACVFVTRSSAEQHERLGYGEGRGVVIPVGFDCHVFKPSAEGRAFVRDVCRADPESVVVGLIGRYHPMKDHRNFFAAAKSLYLRHRSVKFVLAGAGISSDNGELMQLIDDSVPRDTVCLLGERSDMPTITSGLDIASCSSFSEGFPTVLGEAMACGVPCVSTEAGDCGWIIGDTGLVVPPRDSEALAAAWHELITMGAERRRALGARARERVVAQFSLGAVANQYAQVYRASAERRS